MIVKSPKSPGWKLVKRTAAALFVIETGLFFGSYGVWSKLNSDRGMLRCINYAIP